MGQSVGAKALLARHKYIMLNNLYGHILRQALGLPRDGYHISMIYQTRMKTDGSEASPIKAVVTELQNLRTELREVAHSYATRLESEIERVRVAVETGSTAKNLSSAKIRDLRDMLTLLRHRQIKPDKGRRKDLKKIESIVSDLGMLIENW